MKIEKLENMKEATSELEKILQTGFKETDVEITPHCRLYFNGNKRIIYDYKSDKIVLKYEVK